MRILAVTLLMLAACDRGADAKPVERRIDLHDFQAVDLLGPDSVEVREGRAFDVRLRGEPATLDRVAVRRDGDTLSIARRKDTGWRWRSSPPATVLVTMPRLARARLTGSGDLSIDRAADLTADLTGSGDLTVGQLRGRTARLTLTGSGTIAAAGAVDRLMLSATGSGDIDARQVRAGEATVTVTGSGDVTADVVGPAAVSLAGSGSATLGRNARCTVRRRGSGEVRCGG